VTTGDYGVTTRSHLLKVALCKGFGLLSDYVTTVTTGIGMEEFDVLTLRIHPAGVSHLHNPVQKASDLFHGRLTPA